MADIKKELNDIKNAVYGREVRSSIHDGIKKINEESEESKQKAEEAHEITQDLLDETFDSAALEANFEQRLNDEIENLQPEWTGFKNDVTARLADIDNLENYELNSKARKSQGIVSFISDDSHKDDYEVLLPIFRNAGVPYCVAAIPYRIMTNPNYCTVEQLKEIEEEGNEILSHSMNHPYDPPMVENPNDDEVEKEFSESLEWFKEHGFNVQSYAYPGGNYKKRERLFARKYYRAARNSDRGYHDGINYTPLNQYELKTYWVDPTTGDVRDWLNQGYSMSQIHTMVMNRVAELVNEANTKKGWLIISTHSYELNTPELRALFTDVVNYVKNNTRVMTMRDALNEMGNVVDIGDYSEKTHRYGYDGSTHFVAGADGIISGSATVTERNKYTPSTPFRDFPYGTVITPVFATHAQGAPNNMSGLLINHKSFDYRDEPSVNFQEYMTMSRPYARFRRHVRNDLTFGEWFADGGINYPHFNSFDHTTPFSEFPIGITHSRVTGTNPNISTAPLRKNGTLITYKMDRTETGTNYGYQEYHLFASPVCFVRPVVGENKFGDWQLMSPLMATDNNFDHMTEFTTFPIGITYSIVQSDNPNISSAPEGSNGTLITHKLREQGLYSFSFQEYHLFQKSTIYKRYAKGEAEWTGWSEWVKIAD